jgi:hypothetical protein
MQPDPGTYRNLLDLLGWLMNEAGRLWERFRRSKNQIAVFGLAGAGKTTLGTCLSGQHEPGEYEESIGIERHPYEGGEYQLIVPPGQGHRRDASWQTILAEIQKGAALGVIDVVSYGHQSFNFPYRQHALYRYPTMGKERFLREYAEHQRREELACFQKLCASLKAVKSKLWMITLVTKQDLWWDNKEEVRRQYEQGDYATTIADLQQSLASAGFRHEYLYASLVIQNWRDQDGELLRQHSAEYDQVQQAASLKQLLRTLSGLLEG